MSETCTSPSRESWLLDTESWLRGASAARCGGWGLEEAEEGGVDRRGWEELWVDDWVDEGQIGVNADDGGRVVVWGVELVNADCASEREAVEGRVNDWATSQGWMEDGGVEEDCGAQWEEEEAELKEGGRVEEEYAEGQLAEVEVDEATWVWSDDCWLEEVICVSSVLWGILLHKEKQNID